MSTKFLMLWLWLFMVGQLFSYVLDGAFVNGMTSYLNAATGYSVSTYSSSTIWMMMNLSWQFLSVTVPNLLLWNFSFLQDDFVMIKWILIMIFDPALIFGLYTLFKPYLPVK